MVIGWQTEKPVVADSDASESFRQRGLIIIFKGSSHLGKSGLEKTEKMSRACSCFFNLSISSPELSGSS